MKSFAKISHSLLDSEKVARLVEMDDTKSLAALGAWLVAVVSSSAAENDGRTPVTRLRSFGSRESLAEAVAQLEKVGLVTRPDPIAVVVSGYDGHNNTREHIDSIRARKSKAGKASAAVRRKAKEEQGLGTACSTESNRLQQPVQSNPTGGEHASSVSSSVSVSEIPDPEPSYVARAGSPTGPFAFDEPTLMVPEHHRKLVMPIVRECRSAFQRAYEQATAGGHWPGYGDTVELEKLAAWALQQGDMVKADPLHLAKGAIAGLFATRKREHWKIRYLLEDPVRYAEAALELGHRVSA